MNEITRFIDLLVKSAREERRISGEDASASLKLARATLIQAIERKLETKWYEIEGAPDDGTYVLILGDDDTIDIASYNRADGWQFKDEQCPSRHCYPTHWQPSPRPPKLKDKS